jgi:hypothetical protein
MKKLIISMIFLVSMISVFLIGCGTKSNSEKSTLSIQEPEKQEFPTGYVEITGKLSVIVDLSGVVSAYIEEKDGSLKRLFLMKELPNVKIDSSYTVFGVDPLKFLLIKKRLNISNYTMYPKIDDCKDIIMETCPEITNEELNTNALALQKILKTIKVDINKETNTPSFSYNYSTPLVVIRMK